jgi:transcriptional regulator with XRE-family HTH domain
MTFGDALAAEIEAAGLTQGKLARELGVSQPTISALLKGAEPKMRLYRALVVRFPSLPARLDSQVEARRA